MDSRDQAFTSGTSQSDELRKRNVASTKTNGTALPVEVDEKTKQQVSQGQKEQAEASVWWTSGQRSDKVPGQISTLDMG